MSFIIFSETWAVVAVLALTLLLVGSVAYERQSGMTFLLGSTLRGRGVLLIRKTLVAALAATVIIYDLLRGIYQPQKYRKTSLSTNRFERPCKAENYRVF